jgi:RNA polymerase sigma-32 factor
MRMPTNTNIVEAPILSAAREAQLIAEARAGSDRAKQELITAHLRLVKRIARRICARPTEDTIAEGMLGLVEALTRFDPEKGARFSTYATHWVRALVTRHVLEHRRIVPAPSTRAARRVFGGIGRAERRLAATEAAPSVERIAAALSVGVADVEEVITSMRARDVPVGVERMGAPEIDPATDAASPEDVVVQADEREWTRRALARAIARLPERERMIIEARRLRDESRTLDDLAGELMLSRERVRQLEERALDRLGTELRAAA